MEQKTKFNRLFSIVLSAVMIISAVPVVSVNAEESTEPYPYTMFAASTDDGAITINADNFSVNGNVATNGTIVSNGNININGTRSENVEESMIFILDKIDNQYFSILNVEEYDEDYILDEMNININVPTEIQGEATLTGNININTAFKALKDVNLYGEVKNTNDSIIFSKYGDISIDSPNVNLNGLVYAPFGCVNITAQNLNLNNVVIIAESIVLTCPNINANNSSNASNFVGNISEPLNIPYDEWQYIKDENENDFPDFFEDFNNWSKLKDSDDDKLPDCIEQYFGTDATLVDTDGDNISDYYEVVILGTDPIIPNDVMPYLQKAYEDLEIELALGDTYDNVNNNVVFPSNSTYDSIVEWTVSDLNVLNIDGSICYDNTVPSEVTCTANIFLFGESITKEFQLKINPKISVNIDINKIKDLTIDDLSEMNTDDEDFEIEINDYGFIEEIFGKYSDINISSSETALYSLYSIKTAIGIVNPFSELEIYDIDRDETGIIFKFRQVVNGIPCFDNNVIISCDDDGKTDYLRSNYSPLNKQISTIPNISYEDINNYIIQNYPNAHIEDADESERLYIYNYYGKAALVWNKFLYSDEGVYQILVDTSNGKIIYKNCIDTSFDKDLTVTKEDLLDAIRTINIVKKDNPFTIDTYNLEDRDRNIIVYNSQNIFNSESYKYKDTSIPVAYTINTLWDKEEISTMANMEDIYDFFYNTFDRISYDDAWTKSTGNTLKIYINTGVENNAFWSKSLKGFVIGQGDGVTTGDLSIKFENKSLSASADVLCHEFTHAVVDHETSLVYFGTAGAINEAYADIFACFFDGNWKVGEDITTDNLRDITSPHLSGFFYSPEFVGDVHPTDSNKGYIDYKTNDNDHGGAHSNSTIISHCAYLMENKGIDRDTLKKLWYKSLCLGYDKHTDFYDVRQNVTKAAKKLNLSKSEKDIINEAFDEVKIDKSCKEDSTYFNYVDSKIISDEFLENKVSINGLVMEAGVDKQNSNTAISQVKINLIDFYENEISSISSDSNGKYNLETPYCSKYIMNLTKNGYLPETYYVNNVNIAQKEVYCDTIEMIKESQNGFGSASGQIVSALSGNGVGELMLNLRKGINNVYTDILYTTITDLNGNYLFSNIEAGNYTVEIIDNSSRTSDQKYITTYMNIKILGDNTIADQNGVVSTNIENNQIRVVLTWGAKPTDLDSHMISNNAVNPFHVYYSNKQYYEDDKLICMLDLDDVDSFGPETTTLYNPKVGIYQFNVYNFSAEYPIELSDACVRVYLGTDSYPKYTFNVPSGSGRTWNVFCYNSATKTISAINTLK